MDTRFEFALDGYSLLVRRVQHRVFERRSWKRALVHGNAYLLNYCVAGHSVLRGNGPALDYRPGRLFAFTPHSRYHHDPARPASFESFCLAFSIQDHAWDGEQPVRVEAVRSVEVPAPYRDLRARQRRQLEERVFRLVDLMQKRPIAWPFRIREQVLALFSLFLEWDVVRITDTRPEGGSRARHHHVWVLKARRYMEARCHEKLACRDIARYAGVDASYLARLFKAETGRTLMEYLNDVRIETAKDLLVQGHANITEVALMAGFRSPSYFAARFRRATGFPPREYLRRYWEGT
jgi:AraC-like DNA-binding protein